MDKELRAPACFVSPGLATERLVEMFVEMVQPKRPRIGPPPAERAVFRKLRGYLRA